MEKFRNLIISCVLLHLVFTPDALGHYIKGNVQDEAQQLADLIAKLNCFIEEVGKNENRIIEKDKITWLKFKNCVNKDLKFALKRCREHTGNKLLCYETTYFGTLPHGDYLHGNQKTSFEICYEDMKTSLKETSNMNISPWDTIEETCTFTEGKLLKE